MWPPTMNFIKFSGFLWLWCEQHQNQTYVLQFRYNVYICVFFVSFLYRRLMLWYFCTGDLLVFSTYVAKFASRLACLPTLFSYIIFFLKLAHSFYDSPEVNLNFFDFVTVCIYFMYMFCFDTFTFKKKVRVPFSF